MTMKQAGVPISFIYLFIIVGMWIHEGYIGTHILGCMFGSQRTTFLG